MQLGARCSHHHSTVIIHKSHPTKARTISRWTSGIGKTSDIILVLLEFWQCEDAHRGKCSQCSGKAHAIAMGKASFACM